MFRYIEISLNLILIIGTGALPWIRTTVRTGTRILVIETDLPGVPFPTVMYGFSRYPCDVPELPRVFLSINRYVLFSF